MLNLVVTNLTTNMQNNNFLSREKTQALIDGLGVKQSEGKAFLDGLAAKGYTIEGFNDKSTTPIPSQPTFKDRLTEITKTQSEKVQESARLVKEGKQGVLPAIGQTLASGVKAAGESFALPVTMAAEKALQFVGEYAPENIKQAATELVQKGIELSKPSLDAYAALPAEQRANIQALTDLVGGGLDLALGAGAIKPIGTGVVKTAEGAMVAGEKIGQTASTIANAPIVSGTGEVLKSAGRTLKSIPENVAVNVGEMQAKEALVKSIPSAAGQKAARTGIDVADVATLQNAVKTPEAKTLIETVKNFAIGKSKTSPFEVVGRPIVTRLKTLDEQVKNFASELDTVAQNLKGKVVNDLTKIQGSVLDGLDKLQIRIADGGLDFTGSTLEGIGNSGKIIDNVYKRIEKANDAFDLHNLKKYIDANVSYGKRVEGLDAGAERLLKTWRKAIDNTLDTQFTAYNKVNTELTKRIAPLEDLKGILKNADGLDTDLLSEKAGIIARRITSAAASNPEIKQVLRNLDKFTSAKGKTLGKIENLQDLYNVLNKYYDIAPKTGFQNLVKEGTAEATGLYDEVAGKIKGFAGGTNATRQKALEDYLAELLTKTSKTKNKPNK